MLCVSNYIFPSPHVSVVYNMVTKLTEYLNQYITKPVNVSSVGECHYPCCACRFIFPSPHVAVTYRRTLLCYSFRSQTSQLVHHQREEVSMTGIYPVPTIIRKGTCSSFVRKPPFKKKGGGDMNSYNGKDQHDARTLRDYCLW